MFTDWDEMCNLHRRTAIDAFYKVSFDLAKRFHRRRFVFNQSIKNKNCLWQPCLLMDQDKISILYRGPSIDASYKVSVLLDKRFQRIFFRTRPIRKKNCLWRPCLYTDRDEMRNLYSECSIDASHQVSVHLAKRFQRRRFFKNRPIRKELPVASMFFF